MRMQGRALLRLICFCAVSAHAGRQEHWHGAIYIRSPMAKVVVHDGGWWRVRGAGRWKRVGGGGWGVGRG